MKTIPLTRGFEALVDDADYEVISQHKWSLYVTSRGLRYAQRSIKTGANKRTIVLMHRQLLGQSPGDGVKVDHHNGNGLDNQRENLRRASKTQNSQNMVSSPNQKRGLYKGVHFFKRDGNWQAYISVPNPAGKGNGYRKHLGYFPTAEQAAAAYDRAALELFGEFAALNFKAS